MTDVRRETEIKKPRADVEALRADAFRQRGCFDYWMGRFRSDAAHGLSTAEAEGAMLGAYFRLCEIERERYVAIVGTAP